VRKEDERSFQQDEMQADNLGYCRRRTMPDIRIGAYVVKDIAQTRTEGDQDDPDNRLRDLPDLVYKDIKAHEKFVKTMRAIMSS
jgi:hypothetical protein